MSEQHHDTNEAVHETMDKYESNTDAGDVESTSVPDPAISHAPDPDFAQGGNQDADTTEADSSSTVTDQEVREV